MTEQESTLLEVVAVAMCGADASEGLEGQLLRELISRASKGLLEDVAPALNDWRA